VTRDWPTGIFAEHLIHAPHTAVDNHEAAAESVAPSYVKAGDLVGSCQRHGQ
jgi:hypothetical protein